MWIPFRIFVIEYIPNQDMGEQVADNTAPHSTCKLFENTEGEYYPVCQPMETKRLVRGEYHPIGSTLQYPTKWGRKKASLHLVGTKLADAELELENLNRELAKLRSCYSNVLLWEDDSKL